MSKKNANNENFNINEKKESGKRESIVPVLDTECRLYFSYMITKIREEIFNLNRAEFVEQFSNYTNILEGEAKPLSYYAYLAWEQGKTFPMQGNLFLLIMFYRHNGIDITLEELIIPPTYRSLYKSPLTEDFLGSIRTSDEIISKQPDFYYDLSQYKLVKKQFLTLYASHVLYYKYPNGKMEEVIVSSNNPGLIHADGRLELFSRIPEDVEIYVGKYQGTLMDVKKLSYQGTPLLSLTEAKAAYHVWIELLNEVNPDIKKAFAGYYSYHNGTDCFCNADFSIRFPAKEYGNIFIACKEPVTENIDEKDN